MAGIGAEHSMQVIGARWMMDNIFIRTDPAGNIKPDKQKFTGDRRRGCHDHGTDRRQVRQRSREPVYETEASSLPRNQEIHMGLIQACHQNATSCKTGPAVLYSFSSEDLHPAR